MLFLPYDFETTGLTVHPKAPLGMQPRPIEFAGLLTDGKEILETFEFTINPEIVIEEIITKITGLTNEDLECNPPFINFVPQLKEIFKKTDETIAHNHAFDKNILDYALQREGLTLDDVNFPEINICTVEQTLPIFGRRVKLQELYELYFGKYEQKHRALDDVILLHKVCQQIGVYDIWSK